MRMRLPLFPQGAYEARVLNNWSKLVLNVSYDVDDLGSLRRRYIYLVVLHVRVYLQTPSNVQNKNVPYIVKNSLQIHLRYIQIIDSDTYEIHVSWARARFHPWCHTSGTLELDTFDIQTYTICTYEPLPNHIHV